MSVSTTEVGSHAVRDLLKAYDLHHSGTETSSSQQQAVTEPTEANSQQDNPHWWPTNRRRMPAYRKPRTDHRFADRPAGRDNAEGVLVTVMFLGVFMNVSCRPWASRGTEARMGRTTLSLRNS